MITTRPLKLLTQRCLRCLSSHTHSQKYKHHMIIIRRSCCVSRDWLGTHTKVSVLSQFPSILGHTLPKQSLGLWVARVFHLTTDLRHCVQHGQFGSGGCKKYHGTVRDPLNKWYDKWVGYKVAFRPGLGWRYSEVLEITSTTALLVTSTFCVTQNTF